MTEGESCNYALGVKLHCLSAGTVEMARRALLLGMRPPPQQILAAAPFFGADGLAVCILLGRWPTPRGWADAFSGEEIEVVGLPSIAPRCGGAWNEAAMAFGLMRSFGAPCDDEDEVLPNLCALLGFRDELPA